VTARAFLAFTGATLKQVAIDKEKEKTVPDPFGVDTGKALDALLTAWGDAFDEIWVTDDGWFARHKDAGKDEFLTGATPDELNQAIRQDWARREARDG
jgi:hypothetical protein